MIKKIGAVPDGLELSLNQDKIDEEAKFDGYYSIVTSELDMSDQKMHDAYRGLAKIEESFKITKSNFEARPVYVWTLEHIEAHFLTCFVSLVIMKLLEQKTNNKYSITKLIESLKKYTSVNIEHDLYMQNYMDEIIKEFEDLFSIDLSKKYRSLSNIKKFYKYRIISSIYNTKKMS